jgi:alkanesulfonate monooxygenase SsuD/methylene tetrahydromethanopterin reductase-like flavin-dependent oxidoreductase (luciferase family)
MKRLNFLFNDNATYDYMTSTPDVADIYDRQIRLVQVAEQLGFSHYNIPEHQSADVAMWTAPSVFLSAVARQTSVIRLSVNGYLMPFHNPLRLAQDVATLDHLSHGRVDFGALSGVQEHEFMRWNMRFDERREMAEEALEIVEKAWTEEIMTYHGKYWQFDEALPWPMPYQKPHPPIWLGCSSEGTFERAAKKNYNIGFGLDPVGVTAEKVDSWRRMWKDEGHSGPMPHSLYIHTIYVAETDEKAQEEVDPYIRITTFLRQPGRVERTKMGFVRGIGGPSATTGDHTLERQKVYEGMATGVDFWIKQGLALVGSPDTVARGLEERLGAVGFDHLSCAFRPGNLPSPLVEKSMRLFAKEVMPAFA